MYACFKLLAAEALHLVQPQRLANALPKESAGDGSANGAGAHLPTDDCCCSIREPIVTHLHMPIVQGNTQQASGPVVAQPANNLPWQALTVPHMPLCFTSTRPAVTLRLNRRMEAACKTGRG